MAATRSLTAEETEVLAEEDREFSAASATASATSAVYSSRHHNGRRAFFVLPSIVFLLVVSMVPVISNSDGQLFVRFNQLGYRPGDPKSAVALSRQTLPQKFSVVDADTRQ